MPGNILQYDIYIIKKFSLLSGKKLPFVVLQPDFRFWKADSQAKSARQAGWSFLIV
jgi:hypothetical protein